MTVTNHTITTADGRNLEIATMGPETGKTVVMHHGTPGSLLTLQAHARALADHDFFFVFYSRAGYGLSDRREGRSVGDVVEDIRAALNFLGRDEYVAVGWSGGGPHALACAALDAPRCRGAISLAGVAPYGDDFDWTEGMAEENKAEFAATLQGGPVFDEAIRKEAEALKLATADTIIETFGGLLSAPDIATLESEESRQDFANDTSHAFSVSHYGFYDDNRAMVQPWGFAPSDIKVPVGLWFGDNDNMVPATHGQWLAAHIAAATPHFHPAEGHLSVITEYRGDIANEIESFFA